MGMIVSFKQNNQKEKVMEFLLQILAELFNSQDIESNVYEEPVEELELVSVMEDEQSENIFGIMHFH